MTDLARRYGWITAAPLLAVAAIASATYAAAIWAAEFVMDADPFGDSDE